MAEVVNGKTLTIEEQLDRAKVVLYLDKPFFGCLLAHLPTILVGEGHDVTTAATDGFAIWCNRDFFAKLNGPETAWVLAHEVIHVAFGHLWRRGHREPLRANVAMDFATNAILECDKEKLARPENTLYDPQFADMAWEAIYEKLPVDPPQQGWGSHAKWGQDGGAGGEDGEDGDGTAGTLDEASAQALAQEWAERVVQAANTAQMQGKLPAGLQREIDRLLKPIVDWVSVVYPFLTEGAEDYQQIPPDRRFASEDVFLPWLYDEGKLTDFVFCSDTSGSMSAEDCAAQLGELRQILRTVPEVEGYWMIGDAAVHRVVSLDQEPRASDFVGGGGTDFRPFFEEVTKRNLHPRLMVFATDGYGSYPDKAPDYPVIWLLSTDYQPPWGIPLRYERRDD